MGFRNLVVVRLPDSNMKMPTTSTVATIRAALMVATVLKLDLTSFPAFEIARQSRTHSSAGERALHTGEVQGSIPCASTSNVK